MVALIGTTEFLFVSHINQYNTEWPIKNKTFDSLV